MPTPVSRTVSTTSSSSSPTLTALGRDGKTNGVFFRTITSDALQGTAAAKYAIDQGLRKMAIIHVNNDFGVNMLALNHGRPEQLGLRPLLQAFLEFREEVVVRRTKFELNKARDRGHVLVGLAIAVANIDEVIHIIRSSKDPAEARERLVARDWPAGDMMALVDLIADPRSVVLEGSRIRLTDEQARAILALTLSRLTGLGRDEIFAEVLPEDKSAKVAELILEETDDAPLGTVAQALESTPAESLLIGSATDSAETRPALLKAAALVTADPGRRYALLDELAEREGIQVYAGDPDEAVIRRKAQAETPAAAQDGGVAPVRKEP